jgi:peptidoglycan/xylan/chitin deacetylase (PgdA/CDA1 family)
MIPDSLLERVPGRRRSIVSLCYDDALPCHFESVAPLLELHGLRGTFYPHLQSRFLEDVAAWRRVAASGHELGNHTIFHPCYDEKWLDRTYHLRRYSPQRWRDEVKLANAVLHTVDGCTRRTYGNTCHDNRLGEGGGLVRLETLAPDFFVAARGEHTRRPVDLAQPNWFNLGNRGIDGCSFREIRAELETLAASGGWIVYTMHSVGPRDHALHLAEDEHRQLVEWLGGRRDAIWTAPVRSVAETLRGLAPAS